MSNSAKGEIVLRYASGTSFSAADARVFEVLLPAVTDANLFTDQVVVAATGGTSVPLPSTCYFLVVKNLDDTNFVDVDVDDGSANTLIPELGPGQVFLVTDEDMDDTLTLTADTAACRCQIIAVGKDS